MDSPAEVARELARVLAPDDAALDDLAADFWATALWAVNRYAQAVIERRAARTSPLRGVGIMGASMLLRPWIGMLILFLITRDDRALVVSSVLLFLLLVTIDIATRVLTHRNIRGTLGGAA